MKLAELKENLSTIEAVRFRLPDGTYVPDHFHVTELGKITKNFMDCGGKLREEQTISLQLWVANDFDHRLTAGKFLRIVKQAEKTLSLEDVEIEVEYQQDTIGKFGLQMDRSEFILVPLQTACLAMDQCRVVPEKVRVKLSELTKTKVCCGTTSSCC
jgi:hypothetical protein